MLLASFSEIPSIANKFNSFCSNIRIKQAMVDNISYRYKRITKQLNKSYRGIELENSYSLYVGSYGRDTDIYVSDIDILFILPYSEYLKYSNYQGNGQSALLQSVKNSLKNTYSTTHINGDGQVVKIKFNDGISFEIVPCFSNKDKISFTYPDTNDGGKWKTTNPKAEIEEISDANKRCNKNLKKLCRMARAWKETWDVPMNGLLIDTLAYNFLESWIYKDKSYLYYDWMIRDFFEYLNKEQNMNKNYWHAPGSNQHVLNMGNFGYKALRCYNLTREAMEYEKKKMPYSANAKWKEVLGTKFTG
jgi:hypothetical protein